MAAEAFDVDAWVSEYSPRTAEARLWRNDLLVEHQRLDREANAHPGPARQAELVDALEALEREADETATAFTFRALSALGWADLIAKHPPSAEQAKEGYDFDPETFPAAAVAASSLEPRLSVDQVERIRGTVQFSEWQKLWGATLEANLGTLDAFPKSVMAGAIRRLLNGGSGPTAPPGGSPAAPSSPGRRATSGQRSNGKPRKTASAPAAASPATKRSPQRS